MVLLRIRSKNISEANINILDQIYTLKVTGNKRNLIYNDEDKLIGTNPFLLIKGASH